VRRKHEKDSIECRSTFVPPKWIDGKFSVDSDDCERNEFQRRLTVLQEKRGGGNKQTTIFLNCKLSLHPTMHHHHLPSTLIEENALSRMNTLVQLLRKCLSRTTSNILCLMVWVAFDPSNIRLGEDIQGDYTTTLQKESNKILGHRTRPPPKCSIFVTILRIE
jgi:hypothetical protein